MMPCFLQLSTSRLCKDTQLQCMNTSMCPVLQVEFHRYLLQTQMARCPKDKRGLGKKLWRTKRFLQFCAGQTC